jgi:hypothetical protein
VDSNENNPDVHNLILAYRPLATFLAYVAADIEVRKRDGRLPQIPRPVEITRLRLLLPASGPVVELNEEVAIPVTVRAKRALEAGEAVSLSDIEPDECFLVPPEIDGNRVAFYLAISSYLGMFASFDFTPNGPEGPSTAAMKYPVGRLASISELIKSLRPDDQFENLARQNWPPGPGYFPEVLTSGLNPATPAFVDSVDRNYSARYWAKWCGFWREIGACQNRIDYVEKAVERYQSGDYISAIFVATPQIEGIIRDHLTASGVQPSTKLRKMLAQFRKLVLSRPMMFHSERFLNLIVKFIEQDVMRDAGTVSDPRQEINRHGVAHGVFTGFERRDIALKYLVLLDAVLFVVFHDRLVTNRLHQ